jgi:hypothetical protein
MVVSGRAERILVRRIPGSPPFVLSGWDAKVYNRCRFWRRKTSTGFRLRSNFPIDTECGHPGEGGEGPGWGRRRFYG